MLLGTYFTITEKHIHMHIHPAGNAYLRPQPLDGHHSHMHNPMPAGSTAMSTPTNPRNTATTICRMCIISMSIEKC